MPKHPFQDAFQAGIADDIEGAVEKHTLLAVNSTTEITTRSLPRTDYVLVESGENLSLYKRDPANTDPEDGVTLIKDTDDLPFKRIFATIAGAVSVANFGGAVAARFSPTGNVDIATGLTNTSVHDGVTAATGNIAFLQAQTDKSENGLYLVPASGAASRVDAFSAFDVHAGLLVVVQEGTAYEDTLWIGTSDAGGVLETNDLVFAQFTGGGGGVAQNVKDHGAVGDFSVVSDAAITASDATLTSASNPWTSADVGKPIAVDGAGAAGAVLTTTIAIVNGPGSVELTATASTTVSAKRAEWGTDDTTAIQAAIDAAGSTGGRVYVPPGIYHFTRLDFAEKSGVIFEGDGVQVSRLMPIAGTAAYTGTAGHLFDLTGSDNVVLRRFQVGSFDQLAEARSGIALLQVAANTGNAAHLEGLHFTGKYTQATLVIYGFPSSTAIDSDFYNYLTSTSQRVLSASHDNGFGHTSSFATVTTGSLSSGDWTWIGDEFHKFGGNSTAMVVEFDEVDDHRFIGGNITGGALHYVQLSSSDNLIFDGVTFETESETTPSNVFNVTGSCSVSVNSNTMVFSGGFQTGSGSLHPSGPSQDVITRSTVGATIAANSTVYIGPNGHDANEVNVRFYVTRDCVLSDLRVITSASPGTSESYTITVRDDSVDTGLAATITDAGVIGTDLTTSIDVAAGSLLAVKFVSSAGANATAVAASFGLTPR